LTEKIPAGTGLTTEYFINKNTILPLLKPFIPKNRGETVVNIMKNGSSGGNNIYSEAGLAWTKFSTHKYLRYCAQCVKEDAEIYGEAYWHRLHQIPGIFVCPKHRTLIADSNILNLSLPREFNPAGKYLKEQPESFNSDIMEKLLNFSIDSYWLINHGEILGYYGKTCEIYDVLLKNKGFRYLNGSTRYGRLGSAIAEFYGEDFLDLIEAYNSGACQWCKRILNNTDKVIHPVYHLLLIRFLADSAENFFTGEHGKPPEYLPFGEPPYPCRNKICDYHLTDVIETIFVERVNGEPRATFVCPYCGMTYRRKRNTPKEQQYFGQIDITDYGWKWKQRFIELFTAKTPTYMIAKLMYCDLYTVFKFGLEYGFIPPEKLKKRRPYVPKGTKPKIISTDEQRKYYRERWLNLISANPSARRGDLYLKDSKCYVWLRANDKTWVEQNAPKPQNKGGNVNWGNRDDEYVGLLKDAAEKMRAESGKSKRITLACIARTAGIGKLYRELSSGRLPKTQAFLDDNLESAEQWHRRKILWAVKTLRENGHLNLKWLKKLVALSGDSFKRVQDFAAEAMRSIK